MHGEEKIVYSSNTMEHVQDMQKLIETIESLGNHTVAYLCLDRLDRRNVWASLKLYDS